MKKLSIAVALSILIPYSISAVADTTSPRIPAQDDISTHFLSELKHCAKDAHGNNALSICLQLAYNGLEEQRRQQFQHALDKANNLDGIQRQIAFSSPQNMSGLRDSQKSFIAYREAECRRVQSSYEPGTMAKPMYLRCKIDLTHRRIFDLKS